MGGILVAIVFILLAIFILNTAFSLGGLLIALLAWMLAGMFAGRLLRGRGYGPVWDIALGIAGGVVGSLVLGLLNIGGIGGIPLVGDILVGIIGAVILVYLVRLVGDRNFGR
jgi:uncharacterized membrane protein YeaQ/YmgE (transglycosylase-associated protein family)